MHREATLEVVPVVVFFAALTSPIPFAFGAWWLRLHYRHKERELDVRLREAESRVRTAHLLTELPPWIDNKDPRDVAAWRAADDEVAHLVHPKRATG